MISPRIPREWRQVKMTFLPGPGKVNFNQAKAYASISLLSFMQKTMQELVTRNIRSESLGYFPYTCNNLPTNQRSSQELQHTMWLHIHRKQWKIERYNWALLDTEEASDSTSCDITKAAKWHGLRDNLVMAGFHGGWLKNYSHTQRRNIQGAHGQWMSAEGHFITPYLWSLVVDDVIQGCSDGCYKLGHVLASSVENSPKISHRLFRRLWVLNNIGVVVQVSIHPQNVQHINISWNKDTKTKYISRIPEFVQSVGAAKCTNIKDAKRLSMFKGNGSIPCLNFMYPVVFCDFIKDTNQELIIKQFSWHLVNMSKKFQSIYCKTQCTFRRHNNSINITYTNNMLHVSALMGHHQA